MKLNEFLPTQSSLEIQDIMYDSRTTLSQSVFYCLSGLTHDGHQFVEQAISNGAIAIVASLPLKEFEDQATIIYVDHVETIFYESVAKFFDNPSKKLYIAAITGTNGKTSTAMMSYRLVSKITKAAYIGTLGVLFDDTEYPYEYTTPDYVSMNRYLKQMVDSGVKFCVLEASSQGLEQNRLYGIDFNSVVFTNLTHEHLDFHGTMENYYQMKKKAFIGLDFEDRAIINIDDPYGLRLSQELPIPTLTYSKKTNHATYFLESLETDVSQSKFSLKTKQSVYHFVTDVRGSYNIDNLIDALIVCEQFGLSLETLSQSPVIIGNIEGRLDFIQRPQFPTIVIDYAHTPDAFIKVFEFAKSILPKNGSIVAVFGAAGRRDASKRALLGQVADQYADRIILTEEDQRDEIVSNINAMIREGIKNTPSLEVLNRYEAIRQAIVTSLPQDIILILGKGQENFNQRSSQSSEYQGDYQNALEILNTLEEQENTNGTKIE